MIRVAFRLDANRHIGGGHLIRCARLLSAFDGKDIETILITDEKTRLDFPELCQLFSKVVLLADAHNLSFFQSKLKELTVDNTLNAIIFDHYALPMAHETTARNYAQSVMALDDLEREHDVDVLFHYNMSLGLKSLMTYAAKDSLIMHGPNYFPLDKAFVASEKWKLRPVVKNIFICFGFDDPKLFSAKILDSLYDYDKKLSVNLIMSPLSQERIQDSILRFSEKHNLNVSYNLNADELAKIMLSSDLAIGEGGGNMYERTALGLPSIVYEAIDNQRPNISYIEEQGGGCDAGKMENFSSKSFMFLFNHYVDSVNERQNLSNNCNKIFGKKPRSYLDTFLNSYICDDVRLRQVTMDDTNFIFSLQNTKNRKFYKDPQTPSFEDHVKFMANRILRPMLFFVILHQGKNAGFIRFEKDCKSYNVSIAIAEKSRGRGVAQKALTQALCLFPGKKITAQIHEENKASINIFKNAGFHEFQCDNKFLEFLKEN